MTKFTFRIASCGFAIAFFLFAASSHWGLTTRLARLEAIFWPTALLLSGRASPMHAINVGTLATVFFSALMNGALYFGIAWIVWWAGRSTGITKASPGETDRMVSAFLVVGLGFALLVALVETAFRGLPQFTAHGLADTWLISANLFALIVITCASAGWTMCWLRKYFRPRDHGGHSVSRAATRKP